MATPRRHAEVTGLLSSVHRALRVLETVTQVGDGVTAKAVARRLNYKLSTTYHLLNTLVTEGYLVHLDGNRGYGLGYKVSELHEHFRRGLAVSSRITAVLREVHETAGAPAYYTVFRDADVVVAHVDDCERHPRAQPLTVGFHEACHATAYGKVMLAELPPRALVDRANTDGLAPLTDRTLRTLADLARELIRVRASGIGAEIEEFQPGLACVAAPVRDPAGTVQAAVALSTTPADFARRRAELEDRVRAGAERATLVLADVRSEHRDDPPS